MKMLKSPRYQSKAAGANASPELDRLSNILKTFNDHFGTLFTDADRVAQRIRDDIAPKVAADPAYQNAKKNTPNAARIEHDKALAKVMLTLLKDDTQVYKQFVENESFQRFVTTWCSPSRVATPLRFSKWGDVPLHASVARRTDRSFSSSLTIASVSCPQ